jgi:branched-chain amino acid aminotransferase/4-amino-4-deoxychorismate lyase
VLDGIMRAQVLAAAPAAEVSADLVTLLRAEAAFLTSSLIGIRRVAVLAGRPLGLHPIIDQLDAALAGLF